LTRDRNATVKISGARFPGKNCLLAKQCAFSQVELVTFCLMGNHFHLLVQLDSAEPNPLQDASDKALLDHLELIYSADEVQKIGWQLESFRAGGFEKSAAELRQKYLDRMRDIPSFMQELKQRFSRWHNRRVRRKGTVWEDRYKSVRVEDSETAVRTMAAYIDLNPVRAGLPIAAANQVQAKPCSESLRQQDNRGRPEGLPLERVWRSGGGWEERPGRIEPPWSGPKPATTHRQRPGHRSKPFIAVGCMTKAKWSSTTRAK